MIEIVKILSGTDLRSKGKSEDVVSLVLADPVKFDELWKCIKSEDKVLRMRSADAIQKIIDKMPEIIEKYKNDLIDNVAKIEQQEVKWHVAQILSRIEIKKSEVQKVYKILEDYIKDKSKIVKTFTLQTMTDLCEKYPEYIEKTEINITTQMKSGSPAIISRSKKLLRKLSKLKNIIKGEL